MTIFIGMKKSKRLVESSAGGHIDVAYGIYDRPGPDITNEDLPEFDPIVPKEQVSTQLSTDRPPVDDPDFVPTSQRSFELAMSTLASYVPEDQIDKFYRLVRDKVESMVDDEMLKSRYSGVETMEAVKEKVREIIAEQFKDKDLSYVHRFDPVTVSTSVPLGRAYSYIVSLETAYNLHKEILEEEKKETGEIAGDVNAQMQMELRTAAKTDGQDFSMIDPTLTNSSQDDELLRFLEGEGKEVDPLLSYYFNSPKSDLSKKTIAITKKGFEEIHDYIIGSIENANAQYSDLGVLMSPRIQKDIEEMKETITSDISEFYLPHNIIEHLPKGSTVDGENNTSNILEFLETVGNLLFEFPPMLPSKSVRRNFSVEEGLPSEAPMQAGHKGEMKKAREAFKELLEAIDAYYLSPSYSGKLPIAEVDFVKSVGAFRISAGASNLGVQTLSGTAYSNILNNRFIVKKSHITAIYKFLNAVISGEGGLDMELTQKGEDAATALTALFDLQEENDNHMAAIIKYLYDEMVQEIKNRFKDKHIFIYPDPASKQRKTSAGGVTDLAILKNAGFNIRVRNNHPLIRDRINAVNKGFSHNQFKVNTNKCPKLKQPLENQGYYKKCEPEKFNEHPSIDDWTDSYGYFINRRYPIDKPITDLQIRFSN